MVLTGWTLSHNGIYNPAPKCPTLDAIKAQLDPQELVKLDLLINHLFQLSPHFTPDLMVGARLRPLAECMLATELMFYEKCCNLYGSEFTIHQSMR